MRRSSTPSQQPSGWMRRRRSTHCASCTACLLRCPSTTALIPTAVQYGTVAQFPFQRLPLFRRMFVRRGAVSTWQYPAGLPPKTSVGNFRADTWSVVAGRVPRLVADRQRHAAERRVGACACRFACAFARACVRLFVCLLACLCCILPRFALLCLRRAGRTAVPCGTSGGARLGDGAADGAAIQVGR